MAGFLKSVKQLVDTMATFELPVLDVLNFFLPQPFICADPSVIRVTCNIARIVY
jgi:hypothetical protein